MSEIQKLKDEIFLLKEELRAEKKKNDALRCQIDAMRQQEANMAALFRGAEPTYEGRLANSKMLGRKR